MLIEGNGNAPKKKSTWYWIVQLLKYGAGVLIAIIAYYGAKQEKAQDAQAKALEAITTVKLASEDQSKKISALQKYIEGLETAKKEMLKKCKAEVDTMRGNMTFFLMGESKARTNTAVSIRDRSLLENLLKESAKNAEASRKPTSIKRDKKFLFSRPKSFKTIQKQAQKQIRQQQQQKIQLPAWGD